MSQTYAIETEGLCRAFGTTRAVDGLALRVPAGQIYGLVGPDGAGKTTALRLLCGAITADAGRATVAGIDVARDPEGVRRRLGYMPQRFSLYGDLTVRENMLFYADVFGVAPADRPALLARLLGFSRLTPFQERRAEALSGGMKQKLALACALIHRPEVLLLDEPTTGVDPVSRREFWDILADAVANGGMTVLVATPYMDEAERCHSVGFMRGGRLLASGSPRELQRLLPGSVLEVRVEPRRVAEPALRSLPGVRDVQTFGDRLHLVLDDGLEIERLRAAVRESGAELLTARPVAPSMEDVFMQLQRDARDEELVP